MGGEFISVLLSSFVWIEKAFLGLKLVTLMTHGLGQYVLQTPSDVRVCVSIFEYGSDGTPGPSTPIKKGNSVSRYLVELFRVHIDGGKESTLCSLGSWKKWLTREMEN